MFGNEDGNEAIAESPSFKLSCRLRSLPAQASPALIDFRMLCAPPNSDLTFLQNQMRGVKDGAPLETPGFVLFTLPEAVLLFSFHFLTPSVASLCATTRQHLQHDPRLAVILSASPVSFSRLRALRLPNAQELTPFSYSYLTTAATRPRLGRSCSLSPSPPAPPSHSFSLSMDALPNLLSVSLDYDPSQTELLTPVQLALIPFHPRALQIHLIFAQAEFMRRRDALLTNHKQEIVSLRFLIQALVALRAARASAPPSETVKELIFGRRKDVKAEEISDWEGYIRPAVERGVIEVLPTVLETVRRRKAWSGPRLKLIASFSAGAELEDPLPLVSLAASCSSTE